MLFSERVSFSKKIRRKASSSLPRAENWTTTRVQSSAGATRDGPVSAVATGSPAGAAKLAGHRTAGRAVGMAPEAPGAAAEEVAGQGGAIGPF